MQIQVRFISFLHGIYISSRIFSFNSTYLVIFVNHRNYFWGSFGLYKVSTKLNNLYFSTLCVKEFSLLGFVREINFILQKYNNMHLRVVTPHELIPHENANILTVYFIIAQQIYFFQYFQLQFNLSGNFLVSC